MGLALPAVSCAGRFCSFRHPVVQARFDWTFGVGDTAMLEGLEYLKILVGLIVIVNPLGMVPVFLSMTSRDFPEDRIRIARTASITVGIVLVVSALFGEMLLGFFGISISAFRVGGGILILLMAIDMLNARRSRMKQTREEAEEAEEMETIAVVPLAIPLLAGPGSISTAILYSHMGSGWGHRFSLLLIIAVVVVTVWATFRLAVRFGQMLGTTGINVATRLMGLILAAIAVEFITSGAKELLPGLGKGAEATVAVVNSIILLPVW